MVRLVTNITLFAMAGKLVTLFFINWITIKSNLAFDLQYTLLNQMGNFYKAGRLCHERGQSIPHGNNTALEAFMKVHNVSSTWLNIQLHDLDIWTWVNGTLDLKFCESCKGCGKISMTETKLTEADCAALLMGFICQIKGPCPKDRNVHCKMIKGKTLLIGCHTKNWFTGRSTCTKLDGDLLVVDNSVQGALLNNILPNVKCQNRQTEFFIGLHRLDWFAVGPQDEKESVDHTRWQDEHPSHNQECVEIEKMEVDSQFGWKTKDCFQENYIVCQEYLSVLVKPNITENTTQSDKGFAAPVENTENMTQSDKSLTVPVGPFYFLVIFAALSFLANIILTACVYSKTIKLLRTSREEGGPEPMLTIREERRQEEIELEQLTPE